MQDSFSYKDGQLFCDSVPLREIAQEFDTPCYVYSYSQIVRNYHAFDDAFSSIPHLIAYAIKANSNGAILRTLAQEGSGADVVSGGELVRTLAAGIPAERIVFAGVGKRKEELEYALKSRILLLNVESLEELELLQLITAEQKMRVPIAIRVNPDVEVKTHPYISTGQREDKFGLAVPQALNAYRQARDSQELDPIGIHMHIGSQITELWPYRKALAILLSFMKTLVKEDISLRFLDLGGGLGISYTGQPVPTPFDLAKIVLPMIKNWEGTLILEPGRAIVGNAGLLLTEVLYHKVGPRRPLLIIDAGMNDLMRPCLYGASHRFLPTSNPDRKAREIDVAGPVCESADILGSKCLLPQLNSGEYLAIRDVGAYGFSMSSTYNSRPRPAEVMIQGKQAFLIREREDLADLIAKERIPQFLK